MSMHKRILCTLLAALILLSLIPAFALPTQAASNMKTGEGCVQILKRMEGFVEFPMWDYSHYSVGYGSTCEKDDYPNGITEAEADALLRKFLSTMESELNKFANRNGIVFSQNQFDALMLFTYNCGTGWLYGTSDLRQAVLDDATGNNFIYAMCQWSSAGGEMLPGLVNRRLIESDMYLNGSYTNVKPSNYTYVRYNNNGGDGNRVQGYDSNLKAYVKATPTRSGYKFLGWYSAAEGGSWITELSAQHAEQTIYAHWQSAEVSEQNPVAVSYQRPVSMLPSGELYDAPNGNAAGSLTDTVADIRGEFVDSNGVKWGKLSGGDWVNLGDPRTGIGEEIEDKTGIKVNVTGDYVNVRVGPGTQYGVTAAVVEGDQILLTQAVDVDGVLWGKFRAGWLCLDYTDYAGGLTVGQPPEYIPPQPAGPKPSVPETNVPETTVPETTVPETTAPKEEEKEPVIQGVPATVISTTGLNIRSGAGTKFPRVGSYQPGQKIGIQEQKNVGGVRWGRTDKGWVCMQYVRLDEAETGASGNYGKVISTGNLNIRSGPGVANRPVGKYSSGSRILILEQRDVSGQKWGRTDKGWICMDYVQLEQSGSTSGTTEQDKPENSVPETNKPEVDSDSVIGTVTATGLNIRAKAGTKGTILGGYRRGDKVTILEQTNVNGALWGRTGKGWISLAYVKLDASQTQKPGNTGVITATVLCIRKGPGTGNAVLGSYVKGETVTILQTTKVGITTWGRTDKGWICMDYVK